MESSITHHNAPASTDELFLYPISSPTLHPLSPFLLYGTLSLVAPPHSIFLIDTSSSQSFLSSTFRVYIFTPGQLHRSGSVAGRRRISSERLFCLSNYIILYLNERDNSRTYGVVVCRCAKTCIDIIFLSLISPSNLDVACMHACGPVIFLSSN